MPRVSALVAIGAGLVGALAAAVGATAAPPPQTSPTLQVIAGQGDGPIRMQDFLPEKLRVAVGTTVTWTVAGDDEHTVAFLAGTEGSLERTVPQPEDPSRPRMANPLVWDAVPARGPYDGTYLVNSGALGRGQSFSLTFGTEGRFPFICTLHPRVMVGEVEVVAAGAPSITTQAQVDAEAAAHVPHHMRQVERLLAMRGAPNRVSGPDDSTIWFARAGTEWRTDRPETGHLDIDAFLPDTLTVQQGDTVVWYTDHSVPHTITFLAPGQPTPESWAVGLPDGTLVTPGTPLPDPSVQPRLVSIGRNPERPSPTYDGKSFYSSGQLGGEPPGRWGTTWALTFDTPGTFEYLCLLHLDVGMRGHVAVTPR